jgi:sensor histidine kinase YesM
MNDCTPINMRDPANGPKPVLGYGSFLSRAIWIVAGATLLIFLIFLSTGRIGLSQIGIQIFAVFVYSALIGLPSILILTRISVLFTHRFPRLIFLIQALVLVCTATVGTFAADLLLQFAGIVRAGGYWIELRKSLPFSLVISLMFGLSVSTFETLRSKLQAATLELRTRQVDQERANKLLVEARLSSLESRIHPHFLFNTLNSIASLIPSDPKRAEDTVGKLASLLRFSISSNQSSLVPLAQELKIVRAYLEIEATRFGQRLQYEISVSDSLGDFKVPPLALQMLVENSVKHVVAQRSQPSSIRLDGAQHDGRLELTVTDDGPGFSLADISPDHGLGNLVGRLELLFGEAAHLNVSRIGDKTVVAIAIPAGDPQ